MPQGRQVGDSKGLGGPSLQWTPWQHLPAQPAYFHYQLSGPRDGRRLPEEVAPCGIAPQPPPNVTPSPARLPRPELLCCSLNLFGVLISIMAAEEKH